LAFKVHERAGPSSVPFGELTLALLMVVRRSSMLSPYAASARTLAMTRTAGRWPPLTLTRPTPSICEIFCASRVSARSSSVVSGSVLEISPRVMMGASAGFTLA
jgi:hypothetical protein